MPPLLRNPQIDYNDEYHVSLLLSNVLKFRFVKNLSETLKLSDAKIAYYFINIDDNMISLMFHKVCRQ